MNANQQDPIRINSLGKLAVAVPYLMGYQPDNELVAIGYLDGDIQVTTRITPSEVRRFGYDCTAWRMVSAEATAVHLIAYGPAHEVDAAVFAARDACTRKNLDIYVALRIHDGFWWSYRAPDAPAALIPTDTELVTRLETVFGTPAPAPNLTEWGLEPATGPEAEAMRVAIARAKNRLAAIRRKDGAEQYLYDALYLVESPIYYRRPPDVDETATIAVHLSMADIATEIEGMSIGMINRGDEHASMMLWTWLSARVPEATRWRTTALAAYAAWVNNHTELATEAAELSLSLQPGTDNPIATAVHRAITHGVSIHSDNAADYIIRYDDEN